MDIIGKGYRLKSPKEKNAYSRVQETIILEASSHLPLRHGLCCFLAAMCGNMHGILPTRKAHPSVGVQNLIGIPWLTAHLVNL